MQDAGYSGADISAIHDEIVWLLGLVEEQFADLADAYGVVYAEDHLDEELRDARGACALAAMFVGMSGPSQTPALVAV